MAHRSTPEPNTLGWVVIVGAVVGMIYVFTRKKTASGQPLSTVSAPLAQTVVSPLTTGH